MNIGSLIRGLLGDSKPGEPKSLELREGQVVRGVVLNVSETGREAVVQIQGTPVRAELETPLQPGQTLSLQVGAPGEAGLPVLKAVPDSAAAAAMSVGDALEALGLANEREGKAILDVMRGAQLPLDKETAGRLSQLLASKPGPIPVSQWLEAAAVSLKRGLPLTAETVKGLQQAIFGPRLHELLAKLEHELEQWASGDLPDEQAPQLRGNEAAVRPSAQPASGTQPGAVGEAVARAAVSDAGLPAASAGQPSPRSVQGAAGGPGGASGAAAAAAAAQVGEGTVRAENAGSPAASAGNPGVSGGQSPPMPESALTGEAAGPAAEPEAPSPGGSAPRQAAAPEGQRTPESGGEAGSSVSRPMSGGVPETGTTAGTAVPVGRDSAPRGADSAAAAPGAALPGAPAGDAASDSAGAPAGRSMEAARADQAPPAPAGRAAAGSDPAAAARGGAGNPAVPAGGGGDALLAKLQGVLAELRRTQPQLESDRPPGEPAAAAGGGRASAAGADAPAHADGAWVARVLKLLGAEHEQQAVRGLAADPGQSPAAAQPGGPAAAAADGGLKGTLLQLLGSSDVPAAVKETAGQLVQQLTGQQLLLNTDRTTPFAQVTLFLPLRGPDGEETASVQIQSRRGRKGELDASNCRLWFDLDMKRLGQTLVDVQVVDRIVSLRLHNDLAWVQEAFEESREDIRAAVENIGYQLSGFRTEGLPVPAEKTGTPAGLNGGVAEYTPESYKGVDYRI
ncbi:DNA ligase [Paenibacillus spiritus]|uniref:DNA ligase n=1 Tax=Paenibacillus spiritus TaxID=2496557 RepID=A0A5J5GF23_9BACL|nr:DNA ligase [Paenibacillus spiritus]KAA9006372.1 DNA ligase [Paenibacillus spiritus]